MTPSPILNAFAAGLCSAGAIYFAIEAIWPVALLTGCVALANLGSVAFRKRPE